MTKSPVTCWNARRFIGVIVRGRRTGQTLLSFQPNPALKWWVRHRYESQAPVLWNQRLKAEDPSSSHQGRYISTQ
jgi:hypothetical protein